MGKVVRAVGKVAGVVANIASFIPPLAKLATIAKIVALGSGVVSSLTGGSKVPQSRTQLGRLDATLDTLAPRTMTLGDVTAQSVEARFMP